MANLYQSKEIEQLEKRIQELEDKLNKQSQSLSMFGRSYSQVGSSNSDFLIKTKGQIKIQWGNKFIDLIKDGKVNVDSKVIYKQKEVGQKDGIYVIGEGDSVDVVLVVGGQQLDLTGNMGNTYVSFLSKQETTSENKYQALKNIGFIYESLQDVDDNGLKNGIIYVEQDKKLYVVTDGIPQQFSIEFPNPYNSQFIIAKDTSDIGSLVIKGYGRENSILFESLSIYSQKDESYIDSNGTIYIKVSGDNKVLISDQKVIFSNIVVSQEFQSVNASSAKGFRLYDSGGRSTLEVDNIILRGYNLQANSITNKVLDSYWYYKNNIISSVVPEGDTEYKISFAFQNEFQAQDILYVYTYINIGDLYDKQVLLPLEVSGVYDDSSIYVHINSSHYFSEDQQFIQDNEEAIMTSLPGKTCFLVGSSGEEIIIPKVSSKGFELISSSSFQDEASTQKVLVRVGTLDSLQLKYRENQKEVDIQGQGMYSKLAAFKEAKYVHDYDLPIDDNSSKFASTEWVNKIMPVGSIIMFGAQSAKIPEGWHVCDGTNGTPNLVGRFIKAVGSDSGVGAIASELNENNELTLSKKHLPKHSHPHKPHTHTMQENTSEVTTSSSGDLTVSFNWSDYNWGLSTSSVSVIDSVSGGGVSSTSTSVNSVSGYSTQGGSATGGSHTHTVSLRGTNLTINQSTSQEDTLSDSDWPNNPIKIEPRAYALIFIMRIK